MVNNDFKKISLTKKEGYLINKKTSLRDRPQNVRPAPTPKITPGANEGPEMTNPINDTTLNSVYNKLRKAIDLNTSYSSKLLFSNSISDITHNSLTNHFGGIHG